MSGCHLLGLCFDVAVEHVDLSATHGDIKKQLEQRLSELVASAYQTGTDGEMDCRDPIETMKENYNGFWGPFCHL